MVSLTPWPLVDFARNLRCYQADLSLEERSKVISEVDDMFEGRQRDLEIKIVEVNVFIFK